MPGDFKMELRIGKTTYVLNRTAAEGLLRAAEAFGEDCGEPCKRMRAALRVALETVPGDGREAEVEVEYREDIRVDLSAPERVPDADAPECFLCGERGEALPLCKGDTEPIWVCNTVGCPRRDRPAARLFFETGRR